VAEGVCLSLTFPFPQFSPDVIGAVPGPIPNSCGILPLRTKGTAPAVPFALGFAKMPALFCRMPP